MTEIVTGQPYGEAAEQRRAIESVPLGPQPQAGLSRQPPPALTAPSARPNEPVQAGLASGPGPGPEANGQQDSDQLTIETLRHIRRSFPSKTIDDLILWMMDEA
jgi:hypothetical protein